MQHDGVDSNSREALDLSLALHRELKLQPWHPFIFDIPDDDSPVNLDDLRGRQRAHVRDLLRQLQALAEAEAAEPPP
jgi:hypothetical protein